MFASLLLILLHVLQSVSTSTMEYHNTTDENILLAFKAGLSNQSDVLSSWKKSTDFCQWPGVLCSLKHKHRVTVLNLSSESLAGTISPSIGNLTFLKILDLSGNNLDGEIPSSIGRLARLQFLDLSNNSLHGDITSDLKNCTSLQGISLKSNYLTGEIPAWLGALPSLKLIYLQKNSFTGSIPTSLANLSSLQEIYLTMNQLEGTIPEGFGRLSGLKNIHLGVNHLSGMIPTSIFNISSLSCFGVPMNQLHGLLPSDLGIHLPKLQYLLLGYNHFTGSLPASIANSTEIYSLDISFNNFSGSIPPEIGTLCPDFLSFDTNQLIATTAEDWKFMTFLTNCTRLRILDLQDNMLGGVLPTSVSNLSAQLQLLYVGFNKISGNIPFGISNLVGLNQLQLANNQFTGTLPDNIGRLSFLHLLGIENNLLTGFIPSSVGNLTQLLRLSMDNNMLEGPLPTSIGNLQKITLALFARNKFTGPLPREIFNLSSLSYALVLSGNYFVGPLPPEVGSLTNLAYLYISSNNLSGPLPNELSNCQSLIDLRLDQNLFSGNIPETLSKLRGLTSLTLTKNTLSGVIPQELGLMDGMKELYLAHNNLSGHIPVSIGNMTSLNRLDLSFNHLDGEVPSKGVLSNMTGFVFNGNLGLCGGIPELGLPPCPPVSMGHSLRKSHLVFRVVIPIVGTILFLSLMLAIFVLRKKPKAQSKKTIGFQLIDDKYPRVSYAELVQGTNGFATDSLMGRGRYGSVYKCGLLLKSMMTTVAVKVFDLQQSGSSKSFLAECEALSKIRHRNLINVITCCSSTDIKQNDFKAIVFEFMPNGSLDRWLHLDVTASQPPQGLTLIQRLNIAVDVADALDYLHNNCDPPIVHCDLKPSNILLDEDLVAHVGDFGLAKILADSEGEQPINSKSSIGIRGTIGYVAPEYGEGGQVSPCGDAYSFGIVILELFTGMVPTHDMFRDGLTLQKHVKNVFPGILMKIVDPILLSIEGVYTSNLPPGRNAMEHMNHAILSIMKIALSCSRQAPTERMRIRDAAADLRRVRDSHVRGNEEHLELCSDVTNLASA
ncbi:probable LRR receptor-like serine/threonine-protein kinase At3g47570 isoform X2 [Oryza sativa Japonica Group]